MGTVPMRIHIKVAAKDSARAWGLLVRHSAGTALPERTFTISEEAVQTLIEARIEFTELSREPGSPTADEVGASARI